MQTGELGLATAAAAGGVWRIDAAVAERRAKRLGAVLDTDDPPTKPDRVSVSIAASR